MNRTVQRWLARTLLVSGMGVLLWVVATFLSTALYRHSIQAAIEHGQTSPASGHEPSRPTWLAIGVPIGTLEIVRVGLTGVVIEGGDTDVLASAIGHLPDTPLPWNDGNSALAAHRDAQFRSLQHVRAGDLIRLRTPHGTLDYRVRETLIVGPGDVWVLDQTANPMLTLISCYPFTYIGPAPQRFIVRGDRIAPAAPVNLSDTSNGKGTSDEAGAIRRDLIPTSGSRAWASLVTDQSGIPVVGHDGIDEFLVTPRPWRSGFHQNSQGVGRDCLLMRFVHRT